MSAQARLFAITLVLPLLFALAPADAASRNTSADVRALHTQLERMKSDIQTMDARLREIERNLGAAPSATREAMEPAPPAPPEPAMRPPMAAPPMPPPPPRGPALRQAADPAPYEAATDERIAMFRVAFRPYRWVPVGSRQLALFNTYDQAYLLDFANDCPSLLSAERIRFENFSTRVKVGEHAVIADGQRCLITNIRELRIGKLPKALRP